MWELVDLLSNTGTPYECRIEHLERHETRVACLQSATDLRQHLQPMAFGQERVRDCARRWPGPPVLPTRRPDR